MKTAIGTSVLTALLLFTASTALAQAKLLALYPDNPHYFLFRGKPTVLITSGEHYGAVLNPDFDYVKYLDTLRRDGMNLTRTFTGAAYVEPQGAFNIVKNTLAPAPNRFLAPWARSATPGYANGGNKFDLDKWDENYFKRFRDFVAQASARGVIVEVNLFCPYYGDAQWKLSPFNVTNNVNGLGNLASRRDAYTMDRHGGLLAYQEKFVRRLVSELKGFDNIYYEVCNEPWADDVKPEWQRHIVDVIVDAEKDFAEKHLISLNVSNYAERVQPLHPAVSIFNFHYATPPDTVEWNYHLNKVIGDNETGFRGTDDKPYRMEGWDFIVAGGGLYNNLDYSFTTDTEDGSHIPRDPTPGGGTQALRQQLRVLRDFINSFEFVRMKPDNSIIKGGVPEGCTARALVEAGRAYAIYLRPISHTQFSARWTGLIEPKQSEDYTFYTMSNDGVRLWIGDQLVISNWTDHSNTEDKGTIRLEAGRKYPIKVEYFYARGWGQMSLSWSSASQSKQIVPAQNFSQPGGGQGLQAEYFSGIELKTPLLTRTEADLNQMWGTSFSPFTRPPSSAAALQVELPAGSYRAEWIDPLSGKTAKTENFKHTGGTRNLTAPAFTDDIALRIRQTK
ncbi:MAG: PA14 domain-containing protein [Blastocatellia bacterium]